MDYPTTIPAYAKTVTASIGQISYSVDPEAPFTVNAWNLNNPTPDNGPFWHQPFDPSTGQPFPDQATAQAFADAWIDNNFVNPPTP